jgi:GR25 family glycosyltransferase involved in LPS biosynthesis
MNILYINLQHRIDRNNSILNQFYQIKDHINLSRFNAIKHSNGAIGCALSHINCIDIAINNDWDHVIILEDDFHLLVNPDFFLSHIKTLLQVDFDVCLIAPFLRKITNINHNYAKVIEAQAASGYIIKKHYFHTLLDNFKQAEYALSNNKPYEIFAIDQHWKSLQTKHNWITSIPILGKQSESYSDIEHKQVNYDSAFIKSNINKYLIPQTNTYQEYI